ncbi:PREDICTED: probable LRR receptor-like serine/threonine-protein kinase At4g36180 [Camelina sativa]|uniref:Probable LRR receptor-like serine/threonine-protein kinase At4g36180 n=1 Tax=Camelina sativa TaxID=90675 RepID=A0ABM0W809_CAMSA|nr:PREDICTED: probable LRR receptor-like serine/threonine-protein kinase At4g36180 [Camelina sativa]
MNSCSFTIFIFAAVISISCLTSTRAATCHPDDETGLLAFKAGITRDPLGILSTWKKGTECCSWMGVICITGDRVTELRIYGGGGGSLWGNISMTLARLEHLESVSFTYLKITGSFPQFLFKLPNLNLIRISHTHLSGPLPANIGALSQVEDVALDNNRFTGPIPSSISKLTRLTWLDLGANRLSGTIPNIFKSMTKLLGLDLSRNKFFGKLPTSIASLAPTVTFLDLSQNNLSGAIPNYLSKFGELSTLDLSRNRFSGAVPISFANMTSIFHLKLSHNLLTGRFPAMKFVDGIGSLDLSYNQYHFEMIPEWVTLSPEIYNLKLAKCGIKMRFEDWKPVRTESMHYVDFSENDISGSPASFLNHAAALLEFKMSGNKLRFDFGKVKFTKSLRSLDLSRNLIYGKVPVSVAGLQTLNLSQNHLCGKLPATKFLASVFGGNDCLCGSPLSPCKA